MRSEFSAPENFINREISWLEFNRRVLDEAADGTQPLIERVKFLSIFSSNLDEFFEIRVAGIKQQIESVSIETGPDEMSPTEVFEAIEKLAHHLVGRQYAVWNQEIVPQLSTNGIEICAVDRLSPERAQWAYRYFLNEVLPVLTPLAVDASHPFPQVLNKSHNLLVCAHKPGEREFHYAIVQVPRVAPRFICLPREEEASPWRYIYLAALVKRYVAELFPGWELAGVHAFRVTRNSDLYIDEEEAENLLRTIEQELRRGLRGKAVRLEVEADCPPDFQALLLETFGLAEVDLYKLDGPMSMTHLAPLISNDAFARLRDRPFVPAYPPLMNRHASVMEVMRGQDVLLHHPYQNFEVIVDLIESAAIDPHVLAIKMTLYRTSGDSPFVAALSNAARNGKQVTALVELKARFDEAANIQWAKQLEEAGVHVVYGVVGLKTHCKILLIVRRDDDQIRRYLHLGTGNYHPRTARIYTDLSLLTTEPGLTEEAATLFNTLTGLAEYPGFEKLMVAPFDLARRLKEKIGRERDHAREGRPAHIMAKLNSLVDEEIILALYDASSAGVKIDLIVRGICGLRPNLPGVSENIRVISIVGRFLEHSRIFYFENNGAPEVYLSSADWMPRNFYRRVEIAFLIESPSLRDEIAFEILPAYLADRVKARQLRADGTYARLMPQDGQKPRQAQLYFRNRSRATSVTPREREQAHGERLVPRQSPDGDIGLSGPLVTPGVETPELK
jgi:polyphosphate kinase